MRAFKRIVALVLCIAVILPVCVSAQGNVLRLITPPSSAGFYEGRDWYYIGNKIEPYANFDLTGTVLEVYGEPVEYYVFPWGANMRCEPTNRSWTTGPNDIDIYFDDVDGVSVQSSINLYSISYITVAESPSHTTYIRGIDWDYNSDGRIVVNSVKLDGLKLNVFYQDGTGTTVAYSKKDEIVSWAVTRDDFEFRLGRNELYAVYSGKTVKFNIDIELETITKAYVKTPPAKRSYAFGTDWRYVRGRAVPTVDLTGLVVGAGCNNGETKYISYADEPERFSVAEGQSYSPGLNRLKVIFDSEFEISVDFVAEAYGDIDFDATVNSTDALLILKHIVGTSVLAENQQRYADVNDDGKITSADALSVLHKSVGLIKLFEAEI